MNCKNALVANCCPRNGTYVCNPCGAYACNPNGCHGHSGDVGNSGCSGGSGGDSGGSGGSGGDQSCDHEHVTLSDAINLDRSDIAASAKAVKTAVAKAKTELDVHIADVNAHGGSGSGGDSGGSGGGEGSPTDISQFFSLGDINFFNRKTPPKAYAVANGAFLANADALYPALWAFLQEPENAWRLKTETEWQALIHEDGVGGANAFVLDAEAKTLRLPDIRGDYMAGAGWNGKVVGDSDGDAIRNIEGSWIGFNWLKNILSKVLVSSNGGYPEHRPTLTITDPGMVWGFNLFNASHVVPTDIRNHPATIYMLPCIYVGMSSTPSTPVIS